MPRLDRSIVSSDWDTLKNDDSGLGTVTFPGGVVIAGGGFAIYTTNVAVGGAESFANIRVQNNKEGAKYFIASVQQAFQRTGVVTGFPAPYTVYFAAYHVGGNVIQLQAFAPNPYSDPITCEVGAEVFTALLKTFKQPAFA